MLRRLAARLLIGLATAWAAATLVFFGVEALPGDAAQAALGQDARPVLLAEVRKEFGLNRPVLVRYRDWLSGFLRGDLGKSLPSGRPVTSVIGDKLRNTAWLAAVTIAILIPLGVGLGVATAVRRDRFLDHAVSGSTLALISTPEFVVGTLLAVLLAVWLQWLPPVSLIDPAKSIVGQPRELVLPVLTLLAASIAQTIRMVRASMIDVLQSDYVEIARLKGVPERRVLFRHALPNAFGPMIQVIAINIAWLTGGIVVVESVFQFPGLGSTLVQAVAARDLATVEAITVLFAAIYITVNLIADVAVILFNPRLRRAR
jgi:peptide/nickel transport system permease protein